jgi:putative nucleotidyltransferase with HDIG domain
MQANHPFLIDAGQLRVGLYIHLDVGWMDHPFASSNFKITNPTQIDKIKQAGFKRLRYDPKRSDCEPLHEDELETESIAAPQEPSIPIVESEPIVQLSVTQRLAQLHNAIDEAELRFINAGNAVRESTKNILITPKTCIEQTVKLVNDIIETSLTEGDIAIHALNGNRSSDEHYLHPLNVTVLSLMLAKAMGISEEETRLLGLAAVFHDIGKIEISSKILLKQEPLTKQEQSHFEQHSEIGARMAKEVGLPLRIGKIILQHHVYEDTTGYPQHINPEKVDPLSKIIALVNWYDNLCNPNNINDAKTPYEALALMFAKQRTKFDDTLLKRLIKSLGIYPPGSIIQLTTGVYGVVISVNPTHPMRPYVMLHNPLLHREKPHIVDLSKESNLSISACVRPNQLPRDAFEYLNPRKRINYFVDSELSAANAALNPEP